VIPAAKADSTKCAAPGIQGQAQRGGQRRESGSCRPSLGGAGDRVECWAFSGTLVQAAWQFGQPIEFEKHAGFEKCGQKTGRLPRALAFGETAREKCVIVRPNRSFVMKRADWISPLPN